VTWAASASGESLAPDESSGEVNFEA
jgi:hypothetical protein